VFFSQCTRGAHTAQTQEEYGHAVTTTRQFEESKAANLGTQGLRSTRFSRDLKSSPPMSPYISLPLFRRKKRVSEESSRKKHLHELGIRKFRLLYAMKDKVQRVSLGVRPRGMHLMYALSEASRDSFTAQD